MGLSGVAGAAFTLQGQHSNVGPAKDIPAGISLQAGPTPGRCISSRAARRRRDFPTTPGAPQPQCGSGASDAFVSNLVRRRLAAAAEPRAEQTGVRLVGFGPQFCRTLRRRRRPVDTLVSKFSDDESIYVDLEQNVAVGEK